MKRFVLTLSIILPLILAGFIGSPVLADDPPDSASVNLKVEVVPPPVPIPRGGISMFKFHNLTVENITENSADILWETSRSTTSKLSYWSSSVIIVEDKGYAKEHLVHLENLEDDTTYYFKATCRDRYGLRRSDEGEFTTLEEVVKPVLPEPEEPEPILPEPEELEVVEPEEPEPVEPPPAEPVEPEEPEVIEPAKPEIIVPEKPSYLWAYILGGVLAAGGITLFGLWWRRKKREDN